MMHRVYFLRMSLRGMGPCLLQELLKGVSLPLSPSQSSLKSLGLLILKPGGILGKSFFALYNLVLSHPGDDLDDELMAESLQSLV